MPRPKGSKNKPKTDKPVKKSNVKSTRKTMVEKRTNQIAEYLDLIMKAKSSLTAKERKSLTVFLETTVSEFNNEFLVEDEYIEVEPFAF